MSRRHGRFRFFAMCGTVALVVAGCAENDGLPRQPLAGSVTLDGNGLNHGVISFYPAARVLSGVMVAGGASIDNGRFSISRDEGLIPGQYKIAVHCADVKDENKKGERELENDASVARELIPTRYNSDTTLEIEINDRHIKELKIKLTSR